MSIARLEGTGRRDLLRVLRRVDLGILIPALVLLLIGLVSLASTRPDVVATQVRWGVVGMVGAGVILLVPYERMLALAYPIYALSLLALVLVLIPGIGTNVNGGWRWIRVGGFGFQPSEVAKVALILALARYIRFRRDHRTLRGLVVPFLLTLVPMALVLKEPDLGTALMFIPILFAMLWIAGARTRHLATVVLLGVLSLPLLYTVLAPHQKARIHGYAKALLPQDATESTGTLGTTLSGADDYQLRESQSAIAGGGWFGQGFGEGVQNELDRVPESSTDFIFTVHAEEWGFVGTLLLLLTIAALLFGMASAARRLRPPAARLLTVGALVLFGTQAIVNLSMTVGLAPITGLPLPFVSYGGTAMLTAWVLLGLVLNARARAPVVFSADDFR